MSYPSDPIETRGTAPENVSALGEEERNEALRLARHSEGHTYWAYTGETGAALARALLTTDTLLQEAQVRIAELEREAEQAYVAYQNATQTRPEHL